MSTVLTPGREIEELTALRRHALVSGVLVLVDVVADPVLELLGALPETVVVVRITVYRAEVTSARQAQPTPGAADLESAPEPKSDAESDAETLRDALGRPPVPTPAEAARLALQAARFELVALRRELARRQADALLS